jgi:phage shock protein C
VLGGVCAGIARSAGLDPLLLRIALVAVTVLTGGAGLVAYLAAWVLIPREAEAPGAPVDGGTPAVGARTAWSAAGKDLRSLADEFRKPQSGSAAHPTGAAHLTAAAHPTVGATTSDDEPAVPTADAPTTVTPSGAPPPGATSDPDTTAGTTEAPVGAVPPQRSPLETADDAATALGDRLRAPEVQAGARRAAASVSQALAASVDEVGRRVRRDRT